MSKEKGAEMKIIILSIIYIACIGSMLGYLYESKPVKFRNNVPVYLSALAKRLIIATLWPIAAPVMFVKSWDESIDDDCKEEQV
jgi:hypothetical protein